MLTETELTERHRRELQLHCESALDISWDVFRAFGLPMAV